MKVFVNPGHAASGEPDPGAVNAELGLRECDLARAVGERAAEFLEMAGCEVRLLQSHNLAGESPGYQNVTECANSWGADLFVSIHCNASRLHNARGFEAFCYDADGEGGKAAFFIQQEIFKGVRPFDPGFWDRGVKVNRSFAVLRCTAMPAVLVETGFIDNQQDAELLTEHREEIATAIARGVTDWWGIK
ncbi:N-acetylmuramoyl-L-alanine amidase family protein [Selenomonas sp. KH1T6]|uniref:N-acetylmuramoyl-L-alanine amidase family protein n=1 Tax=Selenomonas sp. KH1T6 TaxID=3158784 RepID=UPI0008A7A414|nr:N-acetylmuramoyl-L-alanine amidase [Selenomonas ruminantium]